MIKIRSLETAVYRYPLKTPVQTSFGIMRDRPMVLVKLLDDEGVTGIGEIWCNFPSVGAEHRANLALAQSDKDELLTKAINNSDSFSGSEIKEII